MNVVLIKHTGCHRNFMFEVPANITLKEGEEVIVQTINGEKSGVCTYDSFELDGKALMTVGKIVDATFPLKPVVGKLCVERFNKEV